MKFKNTSCIRCVGENTKLIKFEKTKSGKQRFQCNSCKKTYILQYSYQAYRKNINQKIILFIREGIGIRGISRILKISSTTLLKRIIKISESILPPILSLGQSYQADELRTFIQKKKNIIWLVYAIERSTKTVAYFSLGKRTNETLFQVIKVLTDSKPFKIHTDKLKNYKYLIPESIHSTKRFSTNSIERKNLTIRTHLKRFNRRTICFTKSIIVLNSLLKIYFWA